MERLSTPVEPQRVRRRGQRFVSPDTKVITRAAKATGGAGGGGWQIRRGGTAPGARRVDCEGQGQGRKVEGLNLLPSATHDLTAALAAGEERAVETFYQRYFDWLYAQARRATRRDESFCLD